MKGIVVASHGKMAEGLLDSLSLFAGNLEQVKACCLLPGQTMEEFSEDIKKAIDETNTGDGVYCFCDLLFGTPCNCLAMLLRNPKYMGQIEIVTGVNLPMLLEYSSARTTETDNYKEQLIQIGKDGIVDFNKKFSER